MGVAGCPQPVPLIEACLMISAQFHLSLSHTRQGSCQVKTGDCDRQQPWSWVLLAKGGCLMVCMAVPKGSDQLESYRWTSLVQDAAARVLQSGLIPNFFQQQLIKSGVIASGGSAAAWRYEVCWQRFVKRMLQDNLRNGVAARPVTGPSPCDKTGQT